MENTINDIVRSLRSAKGIKQYQLAQMAKVSGPNLSRFEAGKLSIGVNTLERIVDALGCKIVITEKN